MKSWLALIEIAKGKRSPTKNGSHPQITMPASRAWKDGRTRLGVKAEHTVDLKTEVILSSVVMHSTQTDQHTLIESVGEAQ